MRPLLKTLLPYFIIKAYRNFKRLRERRIYRGNEVTCPVCQSEFKRFAPYNSSRKNARCIHCGSLERHRLQFLYLTKKTNLFYKDTPLRLLHFAPEKPLYDLFTSHAHIDYITCDMTPSSPDFKEIKGIQYADITNIPFEDNCFDVVICNHVLEHIPDDRKAMKELYRVIKKGGWGIFQVPIRHRIKKTYEDFSITSRKGRKKAFGQHDHVRIYGRDYSDRLMDAGFKVCTDEYARTLSEAESIKYGINQREITFLCQKELS